jgi:hypothetical protein
MLGGQCAGEGFQPCHLDGDRRSKGVEHVSKTRLSSLEGGENDVDHVIFDDAGSRLYHHAIEVGVRGQSSLEPLRCPTPRSFQLRSDSIRTGSCGLPVPLVAVEDRQRPCDPEHRTIEGPEAIADLQPTGADSRGLELTPLELVSCFCSRRTMGERPEVGVVLEFGGSWWRWQQRLDWPDIASNQVAPGGRRCTPCQCLGAGCGDLTFKDLYLEIEASRLDPRCLALFGTSSQPHGEPTGTFEVRLEDRFTLD